MSYLMEKAAEAVLSFFGNLRARDFRPPEVLSGPDRQQYIDEVWGNSNAGKMITISVGAQVPLNPGTYQWYGGMAAGVLQVNNAGTAQTFQLGTGSTFALQSPQNFTNVGTADCQLKYFPEAAATGVPLIQVKNATAAVTSLIIPWAGDWVIVQTRANVLVRSISGSGFYNGALDSVAGDVFTISQTAIL